MWTQVEVGVNGEVFTAARKEERFTLLQDVAVGATIVCEGKHYAVASVENVANRSEVWLVSTIEVIDVKSTARRTQD